MAGKFCVSLSYAKDNCDKATVAFVVANAALGSEKETIVFLVTEGVQLSHAAMRTTSTRRALRRSRTSWPTSRRRAARSLSAHRASNAASSTNTTWLPAPWSSAAQNSSSSSRTGVPACRSERESGRLEAVMSVAPQHLHRPDVAFDGGSLDCGSGLLLQIRGHIDPLPRGGLLEIRSTEPTVAEDLPAWCRMTGNQLVSTVQSGGSWSFLVCKGSLSERTADASPAAGVHPQAAESAPRVADGQLPEPAAVPRIPPLAVTGIGSWPRPRWMLQAIHDHVSGRLGEDAFQETAHDAVRLCVRAQLRAGVDLVTDGEQRRDSYASFVGGRLDNCQLIPITDLLPYVDDPAEFEQELRALDVPAGEVRHPAVFGRLGRSRPLAVHELQFARTLTDRPIKVALPGPYLLTRTMWLECVSDRAYPNREALAEDIVRVLREELFQLLAAGAVLVQFDEPVLTEVVFGEPRGRRSFMCGARRQAGTGRRVGLRRLVTEPSRSRRSAATHGNSYLPRQLEP